MLKYRAYYENPAYYEDEKIRVDGKIMIVPISHRIWAQELWNHFFEISLDNDDVESLFSFEESVVLHFKKIKKFEKSIVEYDESTVCSQISPKLVLQWVIELVVGTCWIIIWISFPKFRMIWRYRYIDNDYCWGSNRNHSL